LVSIVMRVAPKLLVAQFALLVSLINASGAVELPQVLIFTDNSAKLKISNSKVYACSELENIRSSDAKKILIDCSDIENSIEIENFMKQGGNVLFFKGSDGPMPFHSKFGIKIEQSEDPLYKTIGKHEFFSGIKATTLKSDHFLTYDSSNTVLFPILHAQGEYFLNGDRFSPKSFLVGGILRGSPSKAAFSVWPIDQIPTQYCHQILNWFESSTMLDLIAVRATDLDGEEIKFGEDHQNIEGYVNEMEFTFRVAPTFTKIDWSQVPATLTVNMELHILLKQQLHGTLSPDGRQLTFKSKGFSLHRGSTHIYLDLFKEGFLNILAEETIRARPPFAKDSTEFDWNHLHYYVFDVCFACSFLLLICSWLTEQRRSV